VKFSLSTLARRARNPRRSAITIRPINPPAVQATDLYRSAYAPVVALWSETVERLVQAYALSPSELQTDSTADLAVEVERAGQQAVVAVLTARLRVERWARRFEEWHRQRWRGAVLSATSVDLGTMIGAGDVRETLEAVIERNVSLVRSVSDQSRERIADSVFRGLNQRTPAREVAKELREAVGMSRRRALNVASDQMVKLSSSLNEERRRQAGITAFEWIHSEKANPRPEHAARNGFLYSETPSQVGSEYQGKRVRTPPADMPGQLPFCGCTSRAVLIL